MNTLYASPSRKILVVDDDSRLRDLLRRYLTEQGFVVQTAENAREMSKIWYREHIDLLILDLTLPGEDGLSVCRRLRANYDSTPIIMLTAKAEEIDRIIGLEMGADDYLSKPFNPRELLARINAILRRRTTDEHPGAPSQENESIHFGPYILSLSTRTLSRGDTVIPITTGEFSVLKVFVQRQAHGTRTRQRLSSLRPQPRRSNFAVAQNTGKQPFQTSLHTDGLGSGLRVCARRTLLSCAPEGSGLTWGI